MIRNFSKVYLQGNNIEFWHDQDELWKLVCYVHFLLMVLKGLKQHHATQLTTFTREVDRILTHD